MCYVKLTRLSKKNLEHRNDGTVEILNGVHRVGLNEVIYEQRLEEMVI